MARISAAGAFWLLVIVAAAHGQTPAPYVQQVAVVKTLKADLSTIGVIESGLSEKSLQEIRRAGLGQGIKIVIGRAGSAGEVGPLYKKLVSESGVQMIWIPDPSDDMLLGIGFEYLRENTLSDKVGLIVPVEGLVQSGALCSVMTDGGKLKAFVNQRVAQVVGATIPAGDGETITYVAR